MNYDGKEKELPYSGKKFSHPIDFFYVCARELPVYDHL